MGYLGGTAATLSAAEISELKTQFLKLCEEKMQQISAIFSRYQHLEDWLATPEFIPCLEILSHSYFLFSGRRVPISVLAEYRREISQSMVISGTDKVLFDILSSGLRHGDFLTHNHDVEANIAWHPVYIMTGLLCNLLNSWDGVKVSLLDHPDTLPLMVKTLKDGQQAHHNKALSATQDSFIYSCLIVIHNCTSMDDNVPKLREIGVIQAAAPYMNSHCENIRLSSISDVAHLVNKEEAEEYFTSDHRSDFRNLFSRIEKGMATESHEDHLGWSVEQLSRGLERLCRIDANKKVLVEEGCLPLLVQLLKIGYSDGEENNALGSLWALSHDSENKQKLVEESRLIQLVWIKYKVSAGAKRSACYELLSALKEELLKSEEYKDIGREVASLNSDTSTKPGTSVSQDTRD